MDKTKKRVIFELTDEDRNDKELFKKYQTKYHKENSEKSFKKEPFKFERKEETAAAKPIFTFSDLNKQAFTLSDMQELQRLANNKALMFVLSKQDTSIKALEESLDQMKEKIAALEEKIKTFQN